jgi:hypothetical protein
LAPIQRQGPGWRLAIDPSRSPYQALIGGEGWAIELTGQELAELKNLCERLGAEHQALADQLMAEEQLELCLEQGHWWLELSGDRQQWALRFVLESAALGAGRGAEGHWPAPASGAFVRALLQGDCF